MGPRGWASHPLFSAFGKQEKMPTLARWLDTKHLLWADNM